VEKCDRDGQDTDDNIKDRLRFAWWTTKVTHTYTLRIRMCNPSCFSMATVVSQMPLSITLYVHCLSCFSGSEKFDYRVTAHV
jgi:hypothetical protein